MQTQINVYTKLMQCAYTPETEVPERTAPDFQEKFDLYLAEEAICLEQFKADLFTHHGLDVNSPKAKQAFEIAASREGALGFYAIADLFESLLPLVQESH